MAHTQQLQPAPRAQIIKALTAPRTDADIANVLREVHGVLPLACIRLGGMSIEELSIRVARSTLLSGVIAAEQMSLKGNMDFAIRAGVKSHDFGWVALALKEQREDAKARGSGGAGSVDPIDFTKEVAGPDDCTSEELLAVIRRELLADAAPQPGCACILCGKVADAVDDAAAQAPKAPSSEPEDIAST